MLRDKIVNVPDKTIKNLFYGSQVVKLRYITCFHVNLLTLEILILQEDTFNLKKNSFFLRLTCFQNRPLTL